MIGITGGAGFIGQHIISTLIDNDESLEIKVLDNFSHQVHEAWAKERFTEKFPGVQLKVGDVCSKSDVDWLIDGIDILIHLAAETGTGQSMYNITHYTEVNIGGTATLLQGIGERGIKLRKFILASSRSIYGEGLYESCINCLTANDKIIIRKGYDMESGLFEPRCDHCQKSLVPLPTPESCLPNPLSYYAETKLFQERQAEMYRGKYFDQLSIFRFQNVYGAGQSLANPYTGILAIFSNLAKVDAEINVFEDGLESRDFVHVSDVSNVVATSVLSNGSEFDGTFNVGTGIPVTVKFVAEKIKAYFDSQSVINISGDYRVGDIRHNYACLSNLAEAGIDTSKFISFENGLYTFLKCVGTSVSSAFDFDKSIDELKQAGMYVSSTRKYVNK